MSDLDRIVQISISRQAGVASQAGFNDVLVVSEFTRASWTGNAWGATERVRIYTSLAAMVTDGCPTTSFAYLAAAAIFAQSPCLTRVFIGRKLSGGDGSETWADCLTAMTLVAANLAAWYGLIVSTRTGSDQQAIAQWVESNKKMCIFASNDAGVIAATTTDIAAYLNTNSLTRSAVIYHPAADGGSTDPCPDAAWMGAAFPYTPGSLTLAFKTLRGVAVYVLTGTQISNATGKNANVYTSVAGVAITQMGTVGDGEFFDVIWGIDWLQAQIQTNIFNAVTQQAKVPYTDGGIDTVASQLRRSLQAGVANGLLASYTVTVPKVADISSTVKATRNLPNVTFTATLAGAIHTTSISGVVTQ